MTEVVMRSNEENIKSFIKYFELGCICIDSGDLKLVDSNITDVEALSYYETKCICSRNYIDKSK